MHLQNQTSLTVQINLTDPINPTSLQNLISLIGLTVRRSRIGQISQISLENLAGDMETRTMIMTDLLDVMERTIMDEEEKSSK